MAVAQALHYETGGGEAHSQGGLIESLASVALSVSLGATRTVPMLSVDIYT